MEAYLSRRGIGSAKDLEKRLVVGAENSALLDQRSWEGGKRYLGRPSIEFPSAPPLRVRSESS
jgi:hypothetical protein